MRSTQCPDCQAVFTEKAKLTRHLRRVHVYSLDEAKLKVHNLIAEARSLRFQSYAAAYSVVPTPRVLAQQQEMERDIQDVDFSL